MSTIRDVAEMAGVSPTTVSRVLNRKMLVRRETEERVWDAAKVLGYQPNASARALSTRQTSSIGIVVRDICDPFFPPIVHWVTYVANTFGYSSFLCNLSTEPDTAFYLQLVRAKRVDGIIIATSHIPDEQVVLVLNEGVPLVLVNREMDSVVSVCTDNEQGGWDATKHLIDLGHQDIAYIGVPSFIQSGVPRRAGYERALREHSLPLDPNLLFEEENSADGGYRAAKDLLSTGEKASAVFVYDDVMAIGAIRAFEEMGVRVPNDMSVVGYDDIPLSAHLNPPLTTVRQAKDAMGIRAMQTLVALMQGEELAERQVSLPPELIERLSSSVASQRQRSKLTAELDPQETTVWKVHNG